LVLRTLHYRLNSADILVSIELPGSFGELLRPFLSPRFSPEQVYASEDFDPQIIYQDIKSLSHNVIYPYRLLMGSFDYMVYRMLPRQPFYITLLCEPVSRVVNTFMQIKKAENHPLHNTLVSEQLDLHSFVTHPKCKPYVENIQTKRLAGNPANEAVQFSESVLRELARIRLDEFAFFGLSEMLEESIDLLSFTFGWESNFVDQLAEDSRLRTSDLDYDIDKKVDRAIRSRNEFDLALYESALQLFKDRLKLMQSMKRRRWIIPKFSEKDLFLTLRYFFLPVGSKRYETARRIKHRLKGKRNP